MLKLLPLHGSNWEAAGFSVHRETGLDIESCNLLALIVEAEMKDFQPLFYGSFANVVDQAARIKTRDCWKSCIEEGFVDFSARSQYKQAITKLVGHWLANGYSW